jgi:cell division protein FtsB
MKVFAAFGLCLVLFSLFTGERSLPALLKARREADALALRIATLRSENARLKARADALRTDPAAIEAVARETLGFARPDEIVVMRRR